MDNLIEDKLSLDYVAGYFDGEGCICLNKHKHKGYKNFYFQLRVQIGTTDKPMLEKLQKQFGGKLHPMSHWNKNWTPAWVWGLWAQQALGFLEILLPHLHTKKEQAILSIEFQKGQSNSKSGNTRWNTEDERIAMFEKRNRLYQQLAELKGNASSTYRKQRLNDRATLVEAIV